MITANPYILCEEEIGLSFEVPDLIAKTYDIDLEDENRIRAAIRYVLSQNLNNGHTCLPLKKLLSAAVPLLAVEADVVQSCIERMAADESLIEVERGQPYYYLPDLFVAENSIASRIAEMVGELVFEPENADQLIDAEERRLGMIYETCLLYTSRCV